MGLIFDIVTYPSYDGSNSDNLVLPCHHTTKALSQVLIITCVNYLYNVPGCFITYIPVSCKTLPSPYLSGLVATLRNPLLGRASLFPKLPGML